MLVFYLQIRFEVVSYFTLSSLEIVFELFMEVELEI